MPTQLTIRGVSDELNQRLTQLGKSKGQSVNAVALRILEEAVGMDARRRRLDRYMTWSPADLDEFNQGLRAQRVVDDDLWR